jgi:hypothetical protein
MTVGPHGGGERHRRCLSPFPTRRTAGGVGLDVGEVQGGRRARLDGSPTRVKQVALVLGGSCQLFPVHVEDATPVPVDPDVAGSTNVDDGAEAAVTEQPNERGKSAHPDPGRRTRCVILL